MASPDDPREDDVVRVPEILDEEERGQAERTADVQGIIKTLTTVAGVGVDLALGFPVTTLGGALRDFYGRRKKPLVEARLNATLRGIERRLEEFGERLDREFITTDEFLEMADEVFERVARERDEDKRVLYAGILANTARTNADRSFYPTALKLLDALEPIHIEILRELQRQREKREGGGGESNTSTRELAIRLHLKKLEELRVGGLSEEAPEFFKTKLKGATAWDKALGQAHATHTPAFGNVAGPCVIALVVELPPESGHLIS